MKQKRNQRFSDAHTAITTKRQMGGSNTKHIEAFVCRGARKNMGQYPTPDIQTMEQKNHWEGDIYVYHGGTVQQSDKEKIKQVRIHQSVVTIKGAAFDGCSNLTNIIIIDESTKNNLKHIGKKSFCHCTALTNVDFGTTNIETIDCDAFLGCTKLTTIRLPSTTKYIKNQCFRECTSLTTIDGLESTCVEIIGDRAFLRCPNLITVNLPATITRIGVQSFYRCSGISNLDLRETSIEVIDVYAFFGCDNLNTIILPETTKRIGMGCLYKCSQLSFVNLYETSIEHSIDVRGFLSCYNLKTISPSSIVGRKLERAASLSA